jgi:hypothetical protein
MATRPGSPNAHYKMAGKIPALQDGYKTGITDHPYYKMAGKIPALQDGYKSGITDHPHYKMAGKIPALQKILPPKRLPVTGVDDLDG